MIVTCANQGFSTSLLDVRPTGALALGDGRIWLGRGTGHAGMAVGELCFNTAMTGYQEVLTDPSYNQQIVLFTFPHIGNVGANADDMEPSSQRGEIGACGAVFRARISEASNHRSEQSLSDWLAARQIVGLGEVDTRALTNVLREEGMQRAALLNAPDGKIDTDALIAAAKAWSGLDGADLARDVATDAPFGNAQGRWERGTFVDGQGGLHAVVLDFGVKRNILRSLASAGVRTTVLPGDASLDEIRAIGADGVILSNGPGDPAATHHRVGQTISGLLKAGTPLLGICLGHQLLALALGAKTVKMDQGHHGANHPVKDLTTGKVEIVSMNHGFAVDADTLPDGVAESHRSLFDGTNCGIAISGKPVISVQHHPEASPGPQDSFYLFDRFARLMATAKASNEG